MKSLVLNGPWGGRWIEADGDRAVVKHPGWRPRGVLARKRYIAYKRVSFGEGIAVWVTEDSPEDVDYVLRIMLIRLESAAVIEDVFSLT